MAHQIAMNIAPGSPDLAIDVELERAALVWVERLPGTHVRRRSSAASMRRFCAMKQSTFDFAIRSQALEWLFQADAASSRTNPAAPAKPSFHQFAAVPGAGLYEAIVKSVIA